MRSSFGRIVTLVVSLALALALAPAERARADDGVGAVRFGLHVPALSLLGLDRDPARGTSVTSHPAFQAGVIPVFGLDVGYQLHENVAIAATVIAGAVGSTESNNVTLAAAGVVPRVEAGMSSGVLRLYGAAEFGIGFFGIFGSMCSGPGCNPSWGAYLAGGEVGVHIFAERSFSIDPYLSFRYLRAFDLDTGALLGQVGIAITGWIGGAPAD